MSTILIKILTRNTHYTHTPTHNCTTYYKLLYLHTPYTKHTYNNNYITVTFTKTRIDFVPSYSINNDLLLWLTR